MNLFGVNDELVVALCDVLGSNYKIICMLIHEQSLLSTGFKSLNIRIVILVTKLCYFQRFMQAYDMI